MIATPQSKQPHFPMILSNGADAVTIGYSGSMASGLTGHAHYEQHQGCPCGWYKIAHLNEHQPPTSPLLVESGYQIILNGEVCDIDNYEQRFDPQAAILYTRASARGAVVAVETFLADNHVLAERYKVEQLPAKAHAQLAFYVRQTDARMGGLKVIHQTEVKATKCQPNGLWFDYQVGGVRGAGAMLSDKDSDEPYEDYPGLMFNRIKKGFSVTKHLVLIDQSDSRQYRKLLGNVVADCRNAGPAKVKAKHAKAWTADAGSSSMSLPDPQMQYLYEYSSYYLRANQHPQTGAITCGPLPQLWSGGIHVPYDAAFAHHALLKSNQVERAKSHLGFYESLRTEGKRLAKSVGLPGAIYSGWSDCLGRHVGSRNWADYALKYKPLMPAYIVLDAYWQWFYDPEDPGHLQRLPLMQEILDLAVSRFIIEKDNVAEMGECTAGNESAVQVQNDTLNGLAYARALAGYAQMAASLGQSGSERYGELAEKLYRGLKGNYKDGVLLPYRGAKYLTGLQLDFHLIDLPYGRDARSVYIGIEAMRTAWGLDSDQPSEAYRDWPWMSMRAAIALAHLRDPKASFDWLKHSITSATALGAIPEKIRMDGYAIGYGYVSPHALLVWAVTHAIAQDAGDDELALFWGIDGQWRDFEFSKIRLRGGLLASGRVADGKVVQIKLANTTREDIVRQIVVNPAYGQGLDKRVCIPGEKAITLS